MLRPSLIEFFTDPVLQAPTLASMLMCLSSALIGVIVFLQKRSLLGEALCHATYPGVVISAVISSFFFSLASDGTAILTLCGAFGTSILALLLIEKLEGKFSVKEDTALCFIIAFFFGLGVLFASKIQFSHTLWYKAVQLFLYGQAATLLGVHVTIYASLALVLCVLLLLFFHPLRMVLFDKQYAKSRAIQARFIEMGLSFLLAVAIIVGIRSVGVVLMSGMLAAPAIGAFQLSRRLQGVFFFAALIGALSGFLGNYFSLEMPYWFSGGDLPSFSLPTGPMILLSSGGICALALLFSPRKGLVSRYLRILRFKRECFEENVLKFLWKKKGALSKMEIFRSQEIKPIFGWFLLLGILRRGWIAKTKEGKIGLSHEGDLKAEKIIRLHRLWEVYLVSLGQGVEKVHRSAEEMEHIISPELEAHLTELLGDPVKDPHSQPIPARLEVF